MSQVLPVSPQCHPWVPVWGQLRLARCYINEQPAVRPSSAHAAPVSSMAPHPSHTSSYVRWQDETPPSFKLSPLHAVRQGTHRPWMPTSPQTPHPLPGAGPSSVRGRPAPGAGAEMHAATTWWHQLKLSEQELINTSCSPWLGNCSAVFSISVVRRVVVKHQVMFYSCRVNGCGLESRSRGWV